MTVHDLALGGCPIPTPLEDYPDTYNGKPLDLIGQVVAKVTPQKCIERYEAARRS